MHSQPRIVVLDDWTDFWNAQPAVERLRQRGEVTIHTTPARDEDEVIRRLEHATVALANRERTPLNGRILRSAASLELLGQTGRIGPNVDAEAATERGIALVGGGGLRGGPSAVAELGLALLAWPGARYPTQRSTRARRRLEGASYPRAGRRHAGHPGAWQHRWGHGTARQGADDERDRLGPNAYP